MAYDRIDREIKLSLIRHLYHKKKFHEILNSQSPMQLGEIQQFLWDGAMQLGHDFEGNVVDRNYITDRMEPTYNYWLRQMCGEPVDTCRGRSCIVSHPVCASRKTIQQIEVIRSIYDRRKKRKGETKEQSLRLLLIYNLKDSRHVAGGIYDINGLPEIVVVSDILEGETKDQTIKKLNGVIEVSVDDLKLDKKITIGEAGFRVVSRRFEAKTEEKGELIAAIIVPLEENKANLDEVFGRIISATNRILVEQQEDEEEEELEGDLHTDGFFG